MAPVYNMAFVPLVVLAALLQLNVIDAVGCQWGIGTNYQGTVSSTASGRQCQRWDTQTPHTDLVGAQQTGAENYCRNPDEDSGGLWCYTMDPNTRWEYCAVPICDCDDTWSVNGTKCYKLIMDRMDCESALQHCLGLGSTLATITSEQTDDFVYSLLSGDIPKSTWIGGTLSADLSTVTWTESEAPFGSENITSEYRRWASGFPKTRTEGDGIISSCLTLNKWGNWRNKYCTSRAAAFTCQKQLACDVANCDGCIHENLCAKCSHGYEDIYNNGSCYAMSSACWSQDGWSLHDTHEGTWSTVDPYYCYKLQAGPANFTSAESGCGEGAQLTPIDTQAENNYVVGLIEGGSAENAWVGERIYHGETPTDYNNFSDVRVVVVNADNSDSCVAVTGNALGRWHNKNCNNEKPFVCRRPWNY